RSNNEALARSRGQVAGLLAGNAGPGSESQARLRLMSTLGTMANGPQATSKRQPPRRGARQPEPPGAADLPHLVVQDVRPSTPHGYPAKAVVGERVPVTASIFRDGHDVLAARAVLRQGDRLVEASPLTLVGNDEWSGCVVPDGTGMFELVVEAWTDRYATWAQKVTVKLAARQGVDLEVAEGAELLAQWVGRGAADDGDRDAVLRALHALRYKGEDGPLRVNPALSASVAHALSGPGLAIDVTSSRPAAIWVERELAGTAAWYELFPRSYGGLRGAAAQIPRLAGLGFDVLYVPPVHPIGHTFRKGRNGSADPGGPGSPWAIGSEDGGHLAIHPDLGNFDDFDYLVNVAREHGVEIAMDYALQCSPDHPWVKEHPEWFHHRPDGTIAYAENPPKKYQDIYPINFWPKEETDRQALWEACREIIDFWAERGVRMFRVDNPHTKPFAFWEWLVKWLREEWPDVVLLAEAFTRPKVMARLAEVGFSQSYTYFTWRRSQYGPEGLRTYVEELAHGPLADYMRPNFWPNTPDILSGPLRAGPPAAFALRYVLAATLSPLYGVYSGYELYENVPASPDNEEYMGSEKYERKARDFSRPGTLGPLFSAVNGVRKRHPAFSRLRTIHFHASDNPDVMAYSKSSDDGADVVLMVVTLDPYAVQEATLHLDPVPLGISAAMPLVVDDELSGERYTWDLHPYVRLDPNWRVAHIFHVPRLS
ncbi:MAG TPA: maltotransferase domain-containing protein, partial [Acidimicrobiales bacterium]|nr:maltotransferase domain-containing protein [Acidimicrobiales bacterium]